MQNTQRASENSELFSMQSTPAAIAAAAATENVWAVWPYCWITAGWDFACNRFHSFHTDHRVRRLARSNRRAQAQFWQGWSRDTTDAELELRLL